MVSVSLRRHESLIESLVPVWGIPYESFIRVTPEISKTTQAIDISFGYPPELVGKILLLKIHHILFEGHREPSWNWLKLLP